jgi:8-oxo-dGTP pyrophosphatase MutT (NUDIX family)
MWPLYPADSVGAIIVTADRRFLLQRRSDIPQIWYPGWWGLFGGGIDHGETELEALTRELKEEIDFDLPNASFFTRFQYDFSFAGGATIMRSFYEVPIDAAQITSMRLLEGQDMRLFEADTVLALPDIVGFEQFALYLYIHRARIRTASAP